MKLNVTAGPADQYMFDEGQKVIAKDKVSYNNWLWWNIQ